MKPKTKDTIRLVVMVGALALNYVLAHQGAPTWASYLTLGVGAVILLAMKYLL